MTHHTGSDEGRDDAWADEVMCRVAPLLAGRDLRTGGAFVTACEEIADALRPVARDLAAAPDALRERVDALAGKLEGFAATTIRADDAPLYAAIAAELRAALAERPDG